MWLKVENSVRAYFTQMRAPRDGGGSLCGRDPFLNHVCVSEERKV